MDLPADDRVLKMKAIANTIWTLLALIGTAGTVAALPPVYTFDDLPTPWDPVDMNYNQAIIDCKKIFEVGK